jgi:hypothetical protein
MIDPVAKLSSGGSRSPSAMPTKIAQRSKFSRCAAPDLTSVRAGQAVSESVIHQRVEICPVCGAQCVQEKCKIVCVSETCIHRVVMNCSEF